ncbi:uncharacterized protein TRIVIDRAFT_219428 [Trichoderma virens Gv29-8]|uniref:Uncharacterized protein n=1 Tax=Hypocrea virens (strain Gv29-8 / FGSC 10586) TaxID=413071 RepID=G9MJK3_HYPVG|nr:uncharacterized protein TRIVIDRAFT_219428 [Trichoderma virens Gv29-8]EHK25666.1 hypothetical protein TRIVIDRAFT_219428 [Trichoderma virens Gv29-8]UKZ48515.1 hypothetical protein TrVGV298_002740 [Trichoderma virens]
MQGPDPEEVKRALLAELGRSRQDELPLSNVAKRPTYQPRNLGTSHIPQARKEKLESKWGTRIVDEESQQMEGLELGNSRPWAQITNQYMARHAVESAPPRLAMGTHQVRPFAIPKAPSSIKSSKGASNVFAQTPPPISKQNVSRNGLQVKASLGSNGQGQNVDASGKNLSKHKPTPSASHQVKEHILSQGECEIIDEIDGSPVAAKFVAKVHIQRNEGLLMLKPSGKPESVYNVLSLGVPAIQGPFCIIYGARNERLHKVKLRTSAAAESFQYLLKSLQQSARQFGETRPASPKPTPVVTASENIPASPLQTPSKAIMEAPEDVPETADDNTRAVLQTPQPLELPLQQESQESLLNLEDELPQQPSLTIEAAADHMQRIVQQILSEITATGVNVPEKGVEEIESTAIANWMAQGFMKSETESDELKDELVELLRLLVRIKRKVQYRHGISAGSSDIPISSATLQDLQEISEKPSKRIKYTTADIKELEMHAVSRQDKIKASGLQEIQRRSPTPVEPKKIPPTPVEPKMSSPTPDEPKKKTAASELSSPTPKADLSSSVTKASSGLSSSATKAPTELSNSTSKASSGPSQSGPKVPGGLATSRWATAGGWSSPTPTAAAAKKTTISPLKATAPVFVSQKPSPKGLSSSRWADKPVENKGAFAGF